MFAVIVILQLNPRTYFALPIRNSAKKYKTVDLGVLLTHKVLCMPIDKRLTSVNDAVRRDVKCEL